MIPNIKQWFLRYPVLSELARNNALNSADQLYYILVAAILNLLLARRLGVEQIGVYFATQATVGLVYSLAHFGVHVVAKREVSRDAQQFQRYFGNVLAIRLMLTLPITVVVSLLATTAFGIGTTQITLLMVVYIFLVGIVGLYASALQTIDEFAAQTRVSIVSRTLYASTLAAALFASRNLLTILAVMVIMQALIWYLYSLTVRGLGYGFRMRYDTALWKSLIWQSTPIVLAGTAEYSNTRADNMLLGAIDGEQSAGIYGAAYTVYTTTAISAYTISMGSFPTLARYSNERNASEYRKLMLKLSLVLALYAIALAVCIYLISPALVRVLYGQAFSDSLKPLQILVWALPFVALNRLFVQALNASDRQKWTFFATTIGAGFNIVLNLFVIPRYGFVGAAYATVLTESLVCLVACVGILQAPHTRG